MRVNLADRPFGRDLDEGVSAVHPCFYLRNTEDMSDCGQKGEDSSKGKARYQLPSTLVP